MYLSEVLLSRNFHIGFDGDRRKYTISNSAGAASVQPYTLRKHTVHEKMSLRYNILKL